MFAAVELDQYLRLIISGLPRPEKYNKALLVLCHNSTTHAMKTPHLTNTDIKKKKISSKRSKHTTTLEFMKLALLTC